MHPNSISDSFRFVGEESTKVLGRQYSPSCPVLRVCKAPCRIATQLLCSALEALLVVIEAFAFAVLGSIDGYGACNGVHDFSAQWQGLLEVPCAVAMEVGTSMRVIAFSSSCHMMDDGIVFHIISGRISPSRGFGGFPANVLKIYTVYITYHVISCHGSNGEAHLTLASPFTHPAACAQLEFGGGRPLATVTGDRWCDPKLLRKPSAEQSGRELQAMEWRRWITRAVGGLLWEAYEWRNAFCFAAVYVATLIPSIVFFGGVKGVMWERGTPPRFG